MQLVRDAREATQAALADGHRLLEVEFPTYSLAAVAGPCALGIARESLHSDACARIMRHLGRVLCVFCKRCTVLSSAGDDDGCAEFNASLNHLRTFCQVFQQQAAKTRIFFPDQSVRHVTDLLRLCCMAESLVVCLNTPCTGAAAGATSCGARQVYGPKLWLGET